MDLLFRFKAKRNIISFIFLCTLGIFQQNIMQINYVTLLRKYGSLLVLDVTAIKCIHVKRLQQNNKFSLLSKIQYHNELFMSSNCISKEGN